MQVLLRSEDVSVISSLVRVLLIDMLVDRAEVIVWIFISDLHQISLRRLQMQSDLLYI